MALRTSAEVNAYFRRVTAHLRPIAKAAMTSAMVETESALRDVAPVDSGEYLAGISRVEVPHENVIGGIKFEAPHSLIVRYYNYGGGTRQALGDAKHRLRNNLVDLSAKLVEVS